MLVRRWLDDAGITDPVHRSGYLACVRHVHDREGLASRLLTLAIPSALRPHTYAVAAVLAIADDSFESGGFDAGGRAMDAWIETVNQAVAGTAEEPMPSAIGHTFRSRGISTGPLSDFAEATRRDVASTGFATHDELRSWTRAIGSAQMRMFWPLLRSADAPDRLADPLLDDLGTVWQLTDILRDLADDLDQGLLYLPVEDLDRFGVTAHDLWHRRWTPGVQALIAFEVESTRALLERVAADLPPLAKAETRYWIRAAIMCAALALTEVLERGPTVLTCPVTSLNGRRAQAVLPYLWHAPTDSRQNLRAGPDRPAGGPRSEGIPQARQPNATATS